MSMWLIWAFGGSGKISDCNAGEAEMWVGALSQEEPGREACLAPVFLPG